MPVVFKQFRCADVNMVRGWILHHVTILTISTVISQVIGTERRDRRKNDYGDNSLWKKEYEDELSDVMLSTKQRSNVTRVEQSPISDNEAVVEKLMDSITASEKYLKKVDSIDFRLNRLDIEVHEKTNSIMKHLAEISKGLRSGEHPDKSDSNLDSIKNEIYQIKFLLEKHQRATNDVDGSEFRTDPSLDSRLNNIENQIKGITSGVESIVSIISEVKSRQFMRTYQKGDIASSIDSVNLINEFRKTLHEQKRKCDCKMPISRVDRSERFPTDCHEIQMQGFNVSGIYKIRPDDIESFYVLCDLRTAGGGWTVLQNRFDGSQDFYKGWSEYKNGFGNLAGEFWLGLEKVNYLTNQKLYELRIEIETQHGQDAYAGYSVFAIGPEHEGFRISTLGTYYGTAGDSLSYHAGQKFSTVDADNDEWKDGACAIEHGGAWWYKECDKSNLNGKYSATADEHRGQSIYWISFKGPNFPLMKTKMMIRPLPASRPHDVASPTRKIPESMKMGAVPNKHRFMDPKAHNPVHEPYRYDNRADAFFK